MTHLRYRLFALFLALAAYALPAAAQTVVSQQAITFPGPVNGGPRVVAVNPVNNKVYIALHGVGKVRVIDGATGAAVDVNVSSFGLPQSLAIDPVSGTVIVGTAGGVAFIDGTSDALLAGPGAGGTLLSFGGPSSIANVAVNAGNVPNRLGLLVDSANNLVWYTDGIENSESNATGVLSCPGPVAVNPVSNRTFVADTCGAKVTWFESSGAPHGDIVIPDNPTAVAVNPVTNTIYVALAGTSGVTVIDGSSNTVTTTIPTPFENPTAVAVNPVTNKIYVANDGDVIEIDGATNATTPIAVGGPGVSLVALSVDNSRNKIYVANQGESSIGIIDGASRSVTNLSIDLGSGGAPNSIAVNPLTSRVYVVDETNGLFTVVDGRTFASTAGAVFVPGATEMVVDPTRARIFLVNGNKVAVGDTTGPFIEANVDVGSPVAHIAVDPISGTLFAALVDNTVKMIGTDNAIVTNPDTTPLIITLDDSPAKTPLAMAVNPATQKVYITTSRGELEVIDAKSRVRGSPITTGNVPADVAVDAANNHVYFVDNEASGFNGNLVPGQPFGSAMNGSTSRSYRVAANPATGRAYIVHPDFIDEFNGLITFPPPIIHSYPVANPPSDIAVNSITNHVYYTDTSTSLHVIDPVAQAELTPITLPDAGNHIAIDELANRIYVSTPTSVVVIDGESAKIAATITESFPGRAAIDPTIGEAWLPTLAGDGHVLVVFDADTRMAVNQFGDGSLIALPGASGVVTSLTSPVFRAVPPDLPYSPNAPGGILPRSGADDLYGPSATGSFDVGLGKYVSGLPSPLKTGLHYLTWFSTDNMSGTVTNSQAGTAGANGGLSYFIGTPTVTAFVVVAPPTLPAPTFDDGTEGVGYTSSQQISPSGGTGGNTFAVTSGALPDGLAIDSGTGAISGMPTLAGTYPFTVTVTDDSGGSTATAMSITIVPGAPHISLNVPGLTVSADVGTTFSSTITATNTGWGSLSFTGIFDVTGPQASAFAVPIIQSTCDTLAHNQTCTFVVTFTPAETGPHSAEVTVHTNDPVNPGFGISVAGTGTTPAFTLTAALNGTGTGTITSSPAGVVCPGPFCAHPFASGTVVTLTATPDAGSAFVQWTGCDSVTNNQCTITIHALATVTATFNVAYTLTAAANGTGSGTITSSPAGITCPGTCAHSFGNGTTVTLTATPSAGSAFAGWGGACTGTGACQVTMDAAKSVTATFNVAAAPTLTLGATSSTVIAGNAVVVFVDVSGGSGTPTGNVTFLDGSTPFGTIPLDGNGHAAHATLALTAGTHTFTVQYPGDASYAAATSPPVTVIVFGGTDIPRLGNISTRMEVLTGANVMIGGFIIGGSTPKTVAITATGPSLAAFGIANFLANPQLTIVRSSDQTVVASNDDWQLDPGAAQLTASGFAPADPHEAGLIVTLPPGAYTAIVQGAGGGVGVSVVGVFEVDHPEIPLVNISTRGFVQTGGNVMIGGFIVNGAAPQTVVVSATGPSLAPFGVSNFLANPQLTLVRSSDQSIIATNDDWQSAPNAAQIQASGFAPGNALESAIMVTLPPGAYTAIVQGAGGGTGVSVIGVFTVP